MVLADVAVGLCGRVFGQVDPNVAVFCHRTATLPMPRVLAAAQVVLVAGNESNVFTRGDPQRGLARGGPLDGPAAAAHAETGRVGGRDQGATSALHGPVLLAP